jgi:ABC-type uncharacterized transport system ATPase subunit
VFPVVESPCGRCDHVCVALTQRESEEGKVTILYATHIFAGLEDWWTHIAYISKGKLTRFGQ